VARGRCTGCFVTVNAGHASILPLAKIAKKRAKSIERLRAATRWQPPAFNGCRKGRPCGKILASPKDAGHHGDGRGLPAYPNQLTEECVSGVAQGPFRTYSEIPQIGNQCPTSALPLPAEVPSGPPFVDRFPAAVFMGRRRGWICSHRSSWRRR